MGYTHYFQQNEAVSDEAWNKIQNDVKIIINHQLKAGVELESSNKEMVNENYININGVGDNAHETFHITKKKMEDFNFCKTARKPYDLTVTSILLVIDEHAKDCFRIGSDGGALGLFEAAKLNYLLFGYGYNLPLSIGDRDSLTNTSKHDNYFKALNIEKEKNRLDITIPEKNGIEELKSKL